MTRALTLEEQELLPPAPLPSEPIPAFSYREHDDVARCSKGHIFSCLSWDTRMARFFGGPKLGSELHPDQVYDHLCPHCEREDWVKVRDSRKDEVIDYEMSVLADQGEWTPHEARKVDL